MSLARISNTVWQACLLQTGGNFCRSVTRLATKTKHGIILNEPDKTSFALLKVMYISHIQF